jgi:hypothetical protein
MNRILALIIAIAAIALVGPVLAQPGAGGGGGTESGGGMGSGATPGGSLRRASMGRGGAAGMLTLMYDPKTVTTVKGAVESLGTLPPTAGGKPNAIRSAVLKTEQGNIRVYLGPDWYLDQQKISLAVGDQLEVTGSKVTMEGQPCIIAKDLKKGDKTVALRDDKGSSAWPPLRRQPRSPAK